MNILNLPDYTVTGIEETREEYRVTVRVTRSHATCPSCQTGEIVVDRWSRSTQTYRDLPMHGRQVTILVERQRFRCRTGSHTFMEPLPSMDDDHRMTRRMAHYIAQRSLQRPFAQVAVELAVHERTVRQIAQRHVKALDARYRVQTPRWLGIDEVHLNRQPRCILTNVLERTVVDFLPKRSKEAVIRRFLDFDQRSTVEVVLMDMWRPYRDAAAAVFPQARVVIDKFHVVKMAGDGLDRVRRDLGAAMEPKERRRIMRDRALLLKRQADLTDAQQFILETWLGNLPLLGQAYHLKEALFEIWDLRDRAEAERRYALWEAAIPAELTYAFHEVTRALGNWHEEAFSYFDHDPAATNAFTESRNRTVRDIDREGRGYSFEMLRAKLLYAPSARRLTPPPPDDGEYVMRDWQPLFIGADLSTLAALLETEEFESEST